MGKKPYRKSKHSKKNEKKINIKKSKRDSEKLILTVSETHGKKIEPCPQKMTGDLLKNIANRYLKKSQERKKTFMT